KRGGGFNLSLIFGRTGIGCRIRCPAGSSVTAKTKSADVTARGTIGGLDVRTASGDVEAVDVAGSVNVKSASGDIRIHTVGGGLNVQTASGDVEIGAVRGPANVQTASGDVHAMVVSGDLELGAVVRGQVNAQSVSGDVTVGVRRGSTAYLDCNTLSGDTSSDLDLQGDAPADGGPLVEVRVKTVSGDIRITRAPAPAQSEEVHA